MSQVMIYSQHGCPNCEMLAKKLDSMGIPYVKLMIDEDYKAKARMIAAGLRSVPAVGADETAPLTGALDELISIAKNIHGIR